jgi:hypothetical protein
MILPSNRLTREHWLLILFIVLSVAAQLRDIRYLSFTSGSLID